MFFSLVLFKIIILYILIMIWCLLSVRCSAGTSQLTPLILRILWGSNYLLILQMKKMRHRDYETAHGTKVVRVCQDLNPGQWDPKSVQWITPNTANTGRKQLSETKNMPLSVPTSQNPPQTLQRWCALKGHSELIKNVDWIYNLVVNNEN